MQQQLQQGAFQVYTGNGKGKTTAALGLALRASGRGFPVYIGQFMKGQDYGELHSLPRLRTVTCEQYGDPGWVYKGKVKPEQRARALAGMEKAHAALTSGQYAIVILDELNMAVWFDLVPLENALALIDGRPPKVELIVTGRNADPQMLQRADLITEMKDQRHYYDAGIPARKGIES